MLKNTSIVSAVLWSLNILHSQNIKCKKIKFSVALRPKTGIDFHWAADQKITFTIRKSRKTLQPKNLHFRLPNVIEIQLIVEAIEQIAFH